MKQLTVVMALMFLTGAAVADSVQCTKITKGNDGSYVEKSYSAYVTGGKALINLHTIGNDGYDQSQDRFSAMARVQDGVVDLVRIIDNTDKTFAEIYSQANVIALQRGNFKATLDCVLVENY